MYRWALWCLIIAGVTFSPPYVSAKVETPAEIRDVVYQLDDCMYKPEAVTCATPGVKALLEGRTGGETMRLLELYAPRSCHTIGHVVGRELFARTSSIENSINDCSYSCGGACNHGITGAAFLTLSGITPEKIDDVHIDSSIIREKGKDVCKVSDGCHGVGHMLFEIFNEFEAPLSICDEISRGLKREDCYWGVFMEHADLVSSHDTFMRADKTFIADENDLLYPCTSISSAYRHACFRYQHRVQERIFDAQDIPNEDRDGLRTGLCQSLEDKDDRASCLQGVGRYLLDRALMSPADAHGVCQTLGEKGDRIACSGSLVRTLVAYSHENTAKKYCSHIESLNERFRCYASLFGAFLFLKLK